MAVPINFVILTVSDSCYAKTSEDRSGPKLEDCIKSSFPNSSVITKDILPDDKSMIANFLTSWSLKNADVILTTGGTGFSSRDVTPEATRSIIDKEAPGLSYAMISRSLAVTDLAMLSRAVCGIKYNTLIINLPGSVKGASECFGFVKNAIPHAVALLKGNQDIVKKDHNRVQGIEDLSKSKRYVYCLAIILATIYAVNSLPTENAEEGGLEKRGLIYQSSQQEAEAAAAARQANSYLNIATAPGAYYPPPPPPAAYPAPLIAAPQYGASSLQYSQQSSEAAASAASRNQYTGLVSNGAYPLTAPPATILRPAAYPTYYAPPPPSPYSLQYAQQSSEAAASAASRNQYTGLTSTDGAYPIAYPPPPPSW